MKIYDSIPATATAVRMRSEGVPGPKASTGAAATYREFEATLLQVLVDQAMPKSESAFGRGVGGNFARSQLAQELGKAVAESGALGIARLLAGAQKVSGH